MTVTEEMKDNVTTLAMDIRTVIWKDNRKPTHFEIIAAMGIVTYAALKQNGIENTYVECIDLFSEVVKQAHKGKAL